MIQQLITSFIASAAFGILFNVPKNTLIKCGIVGMIGWFFYIFLIPKHVDNVIATGVASFIVAVISQFFAKKYKTPVIIFIVAGIIPLVPGGLAYDAMRNFVENDYDSSLRLAAQAFLFSGAIAIGIVFAEVFNQLLKKRKIENKTS